MGYLVVGVWWRSWKYLIQRQRCYQGLKVQGLEVQEQGLVNQSARILKDKDFSRGQQHCKMQYANAVYIAQSVSVDNTEGCG